MRIKENSLINVVENDDYINHHLYKMEKLRDNTMLRFASDLNEKEYKDFYNSQISFIKNKNFRKLILSKKTNKNIFTNYVCPKDIRFDVLRTLPNRNDSILLDENLLMRYSKNNDTIIICFDSRPPNTTKEQRMTLLGNSMNLYNPIYDYCHNFIHIDLVSEKVIFDVPNNTDRYGNFMKEEFFSRFMLVVTYLELTDVTLNIIEGGKSYGTNKKGKIKNDTKKSFILVNTNWNVETITLKDISVRGHWRLQPYGEGRSRYKYVFINPYKKGIVKRLSQKELTS